MSTYKNGHGFETWKSVPSGRSVQNSDGSRTGQWKTLIVLDADDDAYFEFNIGKVWMGGIADGVNGVVCHIYVFDVGNGGALVAEGRHRTEKEAWRRAQRMLSARGYPVTISP